MGSWVVGLFEGEGEMGFLDMPPFSWVSVSEVSCPGFHG